MLFIKQVGKDTDHATYHFNNAIEVCSSNFLSQYSNDYCLS